MIDFTKLNRAINNLEEKKKAKPQVNAASYIRDMSDRYSVVDKYFIGDATPLLTNGDSIYRDTDLATLEFDLSLKSMLEKL